MPHDRRRQIIRTTDDIDASFTGGKHDIHLRLVLKHPLLSVADRIRIIQQERKLIVVYYRRIILHAQIAFYLSRAPQPGRHKHAAVRFSTRVIPLHRLDTDVSTFKGITRQITLLVHHNQIGNHTVIRKQPVHAFLKQFPGSFSGTGYGEMRSIWVLFRFNMIVLCEAGTGKH